MRTAGLILAAALAAGCADHRAPAASPLEDYLARVRRLSAETRPRPPSAIQTLEQRDPDLAVARLLVSVSPTADNHRRVAEAYLRAGVLDAAYDHYSTAIRLDPRDAISFDGRARIWRAWGFPHLGLADAYHAVYLQPASAGARNTLGTLLLRLGQLDAAQTAFERALTLDPSAAFALNNLCYTALLKHQSGAAIARCRAAVNADPAMIAAHNNLALAYAASGDLEAAAREFSLAGSVASARYNLGVALLATRHFADAARAFDEASALRPSLAVARERARQARRLAAENAGAPAPRGAQ